MFKKNTPYLGGNDGWVPPMCMGCNVKKKKNQTKVPKIEMLQLTLPIKLVRIY